MEKNNNNKTINSDAIRFLEWYRRNNVIFQFHCYHIGNKGQYLNSEQLYNLFLKENE